MLTSGDVGDRNAAEGTHLRSSVWGWGGRNGSTMVPFDRAMVVSYRLSVSIATKPSVKCLFKLLSNVV